jgi:hypothetical protein
MNKGDEFVFSFTATDRPCPATEPGWTDMEPLRPTFTAQILARKLAAARQTTPVGFRRGRIRGCSTRNQMSIYLLKYDLCIRCNCDVLPQLDGWLRDGGFITNASALPVTAFQYGYLYEGHEAKISFGRLRCKGMKFFRGTSCASMK